MKKKKYPQISNFKLNFSVELRLVVASNNPFTHLPFTGKVTENSNLALLAI